MIMDNLNKAVTGILLLLASPFVFAAFAVDDYYAMDVQQGSQYLNPALNDTFDNGFTGFTQADFAIIQGQGSIILTSDGPSFQPVQGYLGTAKIRYTLKDDAGIDQAIIFVEVKSNTTGVQAVKDTFYLPAGPGTTTLFVRQNDRIYYLNHDPAVIVSTSGTTNEGGTVTLTQNSLSAVDYTPPSNFTGTDTFTYTIQAQSGTSQATVTVHVGEEPGQGGILTPDGMTDEEARTFAVVAKACGQGNNSLPCNEIANLTPEQQKELAQQVSGRHAKLQARTLQRLQAQQSNNIYIRLKEIRAERNQFSVNGLNLAIMGENVPLGQALQGSLRGGSAGDGELISPWGAFINGKVSIGKSKKTDSRPSYDQDSYSVTLGLDYRLSDAAVVGAAAGLSDSDTDFISTQGNQDTRSFSLVSFGNYYPIDNLYIDGLAMWTQGDLDVARRISVGSIQQDLSSDTKSRQLTASTSVGYEFHLERWQSTLYGRLEYSDLNIDGYTETGGSFGLNVEGQNTHSFTSALGTRLGYVFSWSNGVVVPAIEMEFIKEGSDSFNISNQFASAVAAGGFNINVDEPDTEYMSLSASASAVFGGGRSAFIRYETLLLQDDYDLSSYSVGFRMEF